MHKYYFVSRRGAKTQRRLREADENLSLLVPSPQSLIPILLILLVAVLGLTGCQINSGNLTQEKVVHVTLWQGVNPPPNRDV
ncbi:MAG: hypothetical protein ACR2LR_17810, partial [Hassallia sp.]